MTSSIIRVINFQGSCPILMKIHLLGAFTTEHKTPLSRHLYNVLITSQEWLNLMVKESFDVLSLVLEILTQEEVLNCLVVREEGMDSRG